MHAVAQAWEAGKLFHIDLNDQMPGRFDQDLRFGSSNLKSAFWLVKFLEDVGYSGSRHFDAHAYRTEDYDGVKDFARGCMRTYLILKEKAKHWNADKEIQAILNEISGNGKAMCQDGALFESGSISSCWRHFRQGRDSQEAFAIRASGSTDDRFAARCKVGCTHE